MSKVSSLIKSAQSAQRRNVSYQKQVAAFEWSLSAKTYADYLDYADFLQEMTGLADNASDALSIQNTLKSARRSYMSAEIQRENINIMLGNQDIYGKYNSIVALHEQAMRIGDLDMAQNLANTLYSLDLDIKALEASAQGSAYTAAKNHVKATEDWVDLFENGNPALGGMIETQNGVFKSFSQLNQEFESQGNTSFGYWQDMRDTLNELNSQMQVMLDQAEAMGDQEAYNDVYDEWKDALKSIPTVVGNLNSDEIMVNAGEADAANEQFSTVKTTEKYIDENGEVQTYTKHTMVKNEVDDYIWIRDEDGKYKAIEAGVRPGQTTIDEQLDSRYSDDGKFIAQGEDGYNEATSLKDRLLKAGITIQTGSNGTFYADIPMPGGRNEIVEVTILPGGKIRFMGAPNDFSGDQQGIYEIDVIGLPSDGSTIFDINTNARAVSPDEISDFGDERSYMSAFGKRAVAGILGTIKQPVGINTMRAKALSGASVLSSVIDPETGVETFQYMPGSLTGTAIRSDASPLIQGAMQSAQRRKAELQAQAALQVQAQKTPGLNQMPVRQFAESGERVQQISVKPFTPATQNLQVRDTRKQPSVSVGPTTTKPKVAVSRGPGQTSTGQTDQYGNQIFLGTF